MVLQVAKKSCPGSNEHPIIHQLSAVYEIPASFICTSSSTTVGVGLLMSATTTAISIYSHWCSTHPPT